MPSPKSHLRPAAVAAVLAGERPSDVARRYGLHKATVGKWVRRDAPHMPTGSNLATDQRARTREAMAEAIYDTLIDILSAVRAQLQVTAREEWLAQQTAGDVAALVGTEIDRAIRLLAGFRPVPDEGEHPALGSGGAGTDHAERGAVPERAGR